jgi:hypothetical protein
MMFFVFSKRNRYIAFKYAEEFILKIDEFYNDNLS